MKKIFLCTAAVLLLCQVSAGQPLVIKGRVRCLNPTPHSTKGAENIIVVPTFMPSKSSMTASAPPGYFEVRTGMTLQQLQDKQVSVHLISKCNDCRESVKRIFVSEDQDRRNRDNKVCYVTIRDWKMGKNCSDIELPPRSADSMYRIVIKQPDQRLEEITDATALTGAPAFLNLLTTLASAGAYVPGGSFQAKELGSGKITYGEALFSSAMYHTANPGFNFSPNRDMSEAAFWNPSAIANSRVASNISLLTNIKNNVKLSGFFKLNEKLSLGGGGVFTMQDEFRDVVYRNANNPGDSTRYLIDSTERELKEFAAFVNASYKLNNKLSLGISVKSIWQDLDIPDSLQLLPDTEGEFFDSTAKRQKLDVDLSISYKISKSFQVGLSVMNLAGSALYADAFVPGQQNVPLRNLRSFGLGLCYKWQRFNFGVDLLFTEDDFYDATIGVNYVPFNSALIAAGLAVKQLSYSVSFRIKHFRITYLDDNDFLVNEKRQGKASILNGRIYGGFSFNF